MVSTQSHTHQKEIHISAWLQRDTHHNICNHVLCREEKNMKILFCAY